MPTAYHLQQCKDTGCLDAWHGLHRLWRCMPYVFGDTMVAVEAASLLSVDEQGCEEIAAANRNSELSSERGSERPRLSLDRVVFRHKI